MKKETVEQKFNRMLGIKDEVVQDIKAKSTGRIVGVSEDEIQEFRSVQGLLYFLAAPELFSYKLCGHCTEPFFVSRKYVAFCSYTCIQNELKKLGIEWKKGEDIEALVQSDVYDGNEPIWIRQSLLKVLQETVSSLPNDTVENASNTPLGTVFSVPLPEEPTTISKSDALAALGLGPISKSTTKKPTRTTTSSPPTTTTTSKSTGNSTSSNRGKSRRIISSH